MKKTMMNLLMLVVVVACLGLPVVQAEENKDSLSSVCDDYVKETSYEVLALNLDQNNHSTAEIREYRLLKVKSDRNGNELSTWKVKWGHSKGEMKYETYSFKMVLSSAPIKSMGKCSVRMLVHSDVTE